MTAPGQRLDKWLWFARMAKTRSLAARLVETGKVRVNRVRVVKPSRLVYPDDVLTMVIGGKVRIAKVVDLGTRRGPAKDAHMLYEDLTPSPEPQSPPHEGTASFAQREPGSGRPTKRDRRRIEAWVLPQDSPHGDKGDQ